MDTVVNRTVTVEKVGDFLQANGKTIPAVKITYTRPEILMGQDTGLRPQCRGHREDQSLGPLELHVGPREAEGIRLQHAEMGQLGGLARRSSPRRGSS